MNKTSINIEFVITGDVFDLNYITENINLIPTDLWNKGDLVKNGVRKRDHTCWSFSIGSHESYDIRNQWKTFLDVMKNKESIIKKISKEYKLDFLVLATIEVYDDMKPYITIEKDVMEFTSNINAKIDIDLYNYEN